MKPKEFLDLDIFRQILHSQEGHQVEDANHRCFTGDTNVQVDERCAACQALRSVRNTIGSTGKRLHCSWAAKDWAARHRAANDQLAVALAFASALHMPIVSKAFCNHSRRAMPQPFANAVGVASKGIVLLSPITKIENVTWCQF